MFVLNIKQLEHNLLELI